MKAMNRIAAMVNGNGPAAPAVKKTKKTKGFQIKVEYQPNQNIIYIHSKKMFPKSQTNRLMSSFDKSDRKGNKHPLIQSIRRMKGVLNVNSDHYELRIEKAELFDWDDILPKIRRALKEHFADGKELEELPSHRPDADYLAALRSQGCDV